MSYRAVKDFADARDSYYVYKAGDSFPRKGVAVSPKRIEELVGTSNRLGVPLIEEVREKEVEELVAEQKPQRKPRKAK